MSKYHMDKSQYGNAWFTEFLKKLLSDRGITTGELAKKVGVSHTTVLEWSAGVRSPSLKTFMMIIEAFDMRMIIAE